MSGTASPGLAAIGPGAGRGALEDSHHRGDGDERQADLLERRCRLVEVHRPPSGGRAQRVQPDGRTEWRGDAIPPLHHATPLQGSDAGSAAACMVAACRRRRCCPSEQVADAGGHGSRRCSASRGWSAAGRPWTASAAPARSGSPVTIGIGEGLGVRRESLERLDLVTCWSAARVAVDEVRDHCQGVALDGAWDHPVGARRCTARGTRRWPVTIGIGATPRLSPSARST